MNCNFSASNEAVFLPFSKHLSLDIWGSFVKQANKEGRPENVLNVLRFQPKVEALHLVSAMSVSFPDVLVASIFLTLSGVAVSSTAHCKALYPRDYVCHPAIPSTCLPLDVLLSFRSRISRILLHKHLPYVVPYFNRGSFEIFADLQSWIESGSLASLHHSNHHLTLALALISQGLLEAERDRGYDRSVGIFEKTAGQLLAAVLTGPWVRVASSGWPIFALLGRLVRLKAKAPVQCAGQASQWKEMIHMANQSGVQWPMFNLTVWDLADFHILDKSLKHLDRSCLWDAADQLTIPARPVCVSIPAPGEPQPLMAARDCNLYWPHCETSIGLGHDLIPQSVFWLAKRWMCTTATKASVIYRLSSTSDVFLRLHT